MSESVVFDHIFLCEQIRILGSMSVEDNTIVWRSEDRSIRIDKSDSTKIYWAKTGSTAHIRIVTSSNIYCFDGFKRADHDVLAEQLKSLDLTIQEDPLSSKGTTWGELNFEGSEDHQHIVFTSDNNQRILEFPVEDITQCQLPSKNEVEIRFNDIEEAKDNEEIIESIQFYFPPGVDQSSTFTAAMNFRDTVVSKTDIGSDKSKLIIHLSNVIGNFLAPRGRYAIEMYEKHLKLIGTTYTHKILYSNIDNVFLLPMYDDVHSACILCLNKPQKQGNQSINFIIMQTSYEEGTITFDLSDEQVETRFGGKLHKEESGQMYKLIAKLLKYVAGKTIYKESKYRNSNNKPFIKAVYRSQTGHIYLLEKCIFFIHKPTECILYEDIRSVDFQRYTADTRQGATTFDFKIILRNRSSPITFYSIQHSDFQSMFTYLQGKGIKIENLKYLMSNPTDVLGDESEDSDFDADVAEMEQEQEEEDDNFDAAKNEDNSDNSDESDIVEEDEDLENLIHENNHEIIDLHDDDETNKIRNPKKQKKESKVSKNDEDDEDLDINTM